MTFAIKKTPVSYIHNAWQRPPAGDDVIIVPNQYKMVYSRTDFFPLKKLNLFPSFSIETKCDTHAHFYFHCRGYIKNRKDACKILGRVEEKNTVYTYTHIIKYYSQ